MRFETALLVDLERLKKNFADINSHYPNYAVLPMVKANAYGHGLEACSLALSEAGAKSFGVASLGEGVALRAHLQEFESEIYIFSDLNLFDSKYIEYYIDYKLIPVLHHLEFVEIFLKHSELSFFPLTIKVDTGMNRLGIKMEELPALFSLLKRFGRKDLYHVLSHYSDAGQRRESNKNQRQNLNFSQLKSQLKAEGFAVEKFSFANSGAIEQMMVSTEESILRPGLMLYGPTSLGPVTEVKIPWQDRCISSLVTSVLDYRKIRKGDPVGYGSPPCPESGDLCILPLGYGDGLPTSLTGKRLLIEGEELQIVGRVNMDMIQLLVRPGQKSFKRGEQVRIWSKDGLGVTQICKEIGSIPYEVFCSLSIRLPRKYRKIE
jgi:alanine racemase